MDECPEARLGATDDKCNSGLRVSKTYAYEKKGILKAIGRAANLDSSCRSKWQ